MTETLLETVEIGAESDATHAVIWLHGLGADGNDFVPIVPELRLPAGRKIRFVFPHARMRPVTINMGMTMRAWYDIKSLDRDQEDETGIRESQAEVEALIRRENERGVPSENIILAGFSQGGAITIQTGLRYPEKLAGLLCLSTYAPLSGMLANEALEANQQTPIFLAHGSHDAVLPLELGSSAKAQLEAMGYSVEWHEYMMEHQVCLEEINDISRWIQSVFS